MLEKYFEKFRKNIIGYNQAFDTPYGRKKIVYADWTASGRLYKPIEELLQKRIAPFVGNTHTETTVTGSTMTYAYHEAKQVIRKHVNARPEDVVICSDQGMTGVINKFQRILGLRVHEKYKNMIKMKKEDRPVIFVTSMEHHSNQTSWIETIAEVEIIGLDDKGLFNDLHFEYLLYKHRNRKNKIAAITSCSNVTGIMTPYHKIAEIIHRAGGLCFVDFAASAPYIDIDMHPKNELQKLDAIFFSPHKFLGGPGSTGVMIFDSSLYHNHVPDNPGGGTVDWTNPWGGHKFTDNIEAREDGGTPAFLQTIKAGLAIRLKEQMGTEKMLRREKEILKIIWDGLKNIPNLHLLEENIKERLAMVPFYIDDLHYNLVVRILNDRFGIQSRGGCSCAGTYGHYLLNLSKEYSRRMVELIEHGDMSLRPGWVRLSLHPTMTDEEIYYIVDSIKDISKNHKKYSKDYKYNKRTNEYNYKKKFDYSEKLVEGWFKNEL